MVVLLLLLGEVCCVREIVTHTLFGTAGLPFDIFACDNCLALCCNPLRRSPRLLPLCSLLILLLSTCLCIEQVACRRGSAMPESLGLA